MTELRTKRLLMRRWRPQDREPFAALNADARVMEHFPAVVGRAESDALIESIEAGFDERGWGLWALEVAETGRFLGFTGLAVPSFDAWFTSAVEVGWRLARHAWGYGYATEAARAATTFGCGELGLGEIVSFTALTNTRSIAVMERLGMSRAGTFEHPKLPEGHPLRPHVLFRLVGDAGLPQRA